MFVNFLNSCFKERLNISNIPIKLFFDLISSCNQNLSLLIELLIQSLGLRFVLLIQSLVI